MKSLDLSAELRKQTGSKNAKDIRKNGNVTAVLYGGEKNYDLIIKRIDIERLLAKPETYLINVNFDGKTVRTVLKDVQFDPITDYPIHIDLLEVFDNKPVSVLVPVKTSGVSQGVLAGGKLQIKQRKLKVKAIPSKLPEFIEIDITNLGLGKSIRVEDIKLDGVEILGSPKSLVVHVKTARGSATPAEEAQQEAKK